MFEFVQEALPATRMRTTFKDPYYAKFDKLFKIWHVIVADLDEPLEDEYGDVIEFPNGTEAHLHAWSLIVTMYDLECPHAREQEDLWLAQWEEEEQLRNLGY
jgi:hypothetical protein